MADTVSSDDGEIGETRPDPIINRDEIGESDETGNGIDATERVERARSRIRNRQRRIRPAGNETENTRSESETITVTKTGDKPTVKRTRATAPKVNAKAELEKAIQAEAQQTALIVLTMMNVAASNIAGPEAQMNSFERALIEPAIIRTFVRSDELSERVTQYLDPVAFCFGVTLWASRVWGIRAETIKRAKLGYAPPASEPANLRTESPRAELNGYAMDQEIADAFKDSLIG